VDVSIVDARNIGVRHDDEREIAEGLYTVGKANGKEG